MATNQRAVVNLQEQAAKNLRGRLTEFAAQLMDNVGSPAQIRPAMPPQKTRALRKASRTPPFPPHSLHFLPFLAANRDLSKGWRRLSGKNSFWATSPGRPPRAPLRWIANGRRGRQSGFDGTGQTALSFRTGHRNKYGT